MKTIKILCKKFHFEFEYKAKILSFRETTNKHFSHNPFYKFNLKSVVNIDVRILDMSTLSLRKQLVTSIVLMHYQILLTNLTRIVWKEVRIIDISIEFEGYQCAENI